MNSQRKRMKELMGDDKIIVAPGAFDALSARIVEKAGFKAVYLTGGGISRSWGFPDLGLMTMTENLALISRVCDSVDIPVIADGDTGYGNPLNVVRTIREFKKVGVSCIHLEDQLTPKRCGHYDGKEVISKDEMISKIRAAIDARRDSNLLIIARTDSRAVLGLQEAIERGNAYAVEGADIIFVEAPESVEEISLISREIKAPLMINMIKGSRTPLLEERQLEEMGFKIVIYPNEAHRASIWAVKACIDYLKENGTTKGFDSMVDFSFREEIVGTAEWQKKANRYATVPKTN